MTRKRFIKLLMGEGFPRNAACGMAALGVCLFGSYEKASQPIQASEANVMDIDCIIEAKSKIEGINHARKNKTRKSRRGRTEHKCV